MNQIRTFFTGSRLAPAIRMKTTFENKTALITGGARGLGLILANEYAKRGMKLALCSRTEMDLVEAEKRLIDAHPGAQISTHVCDVSREKAVKVLVDQVEHQFGPIDLLINNAGTILSAPAESTTTQDIESAMDSNFWGTVHTSLEIAPRMKKRGLGRILNIASIGGVVPVPHLLAYGSSKFAAIGFSSGLGIELKKNGVIVTTAVPTLMRTGSFLNASFKGDEKSEMELFTRLSTYPGFSISAESAAASIVRAVDRGQAFAFVGATARLAQLGFSLFPNLVLGAMEQVSKHLPEAQPNASSNRAKKGREIQKDTGSKPQSYLGKRAALRWNETRVE